jgi:hypothetical protein
MRFLVFADVNEIFIQELRSFHSTLNITYNCGILRLTFYSKRDIRSAMCFQYKKVRGSPRLRTLSLRICRAGYCNSKIVL